MSQELQLGKYEFYPYEFDKSDTPTLEELVELLSKRKAKTRKDVKTPSRSLGIDHAVNDVATYRVGAGSLVNETEENVK